MANRTIIYQHKGHFRHGRRVAAAWVAPTEGPFAGLSVWSEEPSSGLQINGGASMELEGVFFTPNADAFTLNGGSPLLPQRAQFIAFRTTIAGGAVLTLAPQLEPRGQHPSPASRTHPMTRDYPYCSAQLRL